jgi:UDP-glucose 4-epimerase
MRDYLHVWDLARAHVRAVERFDEVLATVGSPSVVINVGRGDGVTVRELVDAFERVTGRPVRTSEAPPRPGDAVGAYANVDRSRDLLGWQTELSLDEAIRSALAWADKRHEVLGYE